MIKAPKNEDRLGLGEVEGLYRPVGDGNTTCRGAKLQKDSTKNQRGFSLPAPVVYIVIETIRRASCQLTCRRTLIRGEIEE